MLSHSVLCICLWISLFFSFPKGLSPVSAQSILLPGGRSSLSGSPRVSSCPSPDPSLYLRPVIGILTHPGDGASGRLNNATDASYIAASYVKFVESAGARVIPLIYNEPMDVLLEKLNLVNGVLFTGGWAKKGLYFDIAQKIFEKTLERNDAGDHFPLFAICLGFELLNMIISKDNNILERFNGKDQASTLQFTKNVEIQGTVYQRFPPELLWKLSTECLAMQNHQVFQHTICNCAGNEQENCWSEGRYGISPKRFQENDALSNFFKILTTSTDGNDEVYVSTIQAYSYPVTGFQWHPEKNAFEWGLSMIPHTEDAIQVTQHVANYFISEARRSLNRPPAEKVLASLIYEYSPTYCGTAGKGYDEVYIFS